MDSCTGAHQDGQATQRLTVPETVRTRFDGLPPAQVPELATIVEEEYLAQIEEYHYKIEELHERLREVRSIRNAAATINAKLPPEILMHVFRCVEPNRPQCIQVAHVCHCWRFLVRNTPEFWVKLLDPLAGGAISLQDERHGPVISDMVRNSSPLGYRIALDRYVAAVSEGRIVDDLSRLSSLCLLVVDSSTLDEIRCLSLSSLDTLSIWCEKKLGLYILTNPPPSSSQFPRLRAFETNCASLATLIQSAGIRQLSIGSSASSVCATRPYKRRSFGTCCRVGGIQKMSEIMQQYPSLEVLRFSEGLPTSWLGQDKVTAVLRMPNLRALTIIDEANRIHMFLSCVSIPTTTHVRYEVQKLRRSIAMPSDLSCLPMLPSLDEVEIRIGSYNGTSAGKQVCYVRGVAKGVERLYISVPASKGRFWIVPKAVPRLATFFGSSTIIALSLRCLVRSSHLSEDNIPWIMDTFQHLRDLKVHGQHQLSFLAGLDRVSPDNLRRLKTLKLGSRNPEPGELEAVMRTITSCATRGLRLDAFSYLFLNDGLGSTFKERFELDDTAFCEYQKRLGDVAGSVRMSAVKAKLPAVPKL